MFEAPLKQSVVRPMSAVCNYLMSGSQHYSCMAAQGYGTILLRHAMMSVKVKVTPWRVMQALREGGVIVTLLSQLTH